MAVNPFQRKNIFLLTTHPENKYFFRVPAHQYFYVSSHRRKAFWGRISPMPSSAKSDGAKLCIATQ
jgi:hypothetical protein